MSGPRIPEVYELSLNSVIEQQTLSIVHPIEDNEYVNYIELTLNNSIIHPNNLYVMNITASNPAGRTVIIQDWKLSNLKLIITRATISTPYYLYSWME